MRSIARVIFALIALVWLLVGVLVWHAASAGQSMPGVVYAFVGQDNIDRTICTPGFTESIRPSTTFTNRLKVRMHHDEQLTGTPADYELDHMISLELGGHPSDVRNLWMQPYGGRCNARDKDRIETRLHRMVCTGKISLKAAQHEIATDWVGSYNKRIGLLECK